MFARQFPGALRLAQVLGGWMGTWHPDVVVAWQTLRYRNVTGDTFLLTFQSAGMFFFSAAARPCPQARLGALALDRRM